MENIKSKETTAVPAAPKKAEKAKVVLTPGAGQTFKAESPIIKSIFEDGTTNGGVSTLSLNNIATLELNFTVDELKVKVKNFLKDLADTGIVKDIVSDRTIGKNRNTCICVEIALDRIKAKSDPAGVTNVYHALNKPSNTLVDFKAIPTKVLQLAVSNQIDQIASNGKRHNLIQLCPLKILLNCVLVESTPNLMNAVSALTKNFMFNYVIKGNDVYYYMEKSRDVSDVYKSMMRHTPGGLSILTGAILELDSTNITTVDLIYTNKEMVDFAIAQVVDICYGAGNAVLVDPYRAKVLDGIKSEEDMKHYRSVLYSGTGASQMTRIVGFVLPVADFIVKPKQTGTLFSSMQSNYINIKKVKSMFSKYLTTNRQPIISLTNDGLLLIPEMHKLLFEMSGAKTTDLKIAFTTSPETVGVRLTKI